MLTEKYRPSTLKEYLGNESSMESFTNWIKSWKPGKAVIFHGPPGVGKTSLVYAFAKENNLDLIETNASDLRSSKELKDTISNSVSQKSLMKKGKIFLFDEIDGLSGYGDRGGVKEMMNIIDNTMYPVVLIANDPYNKKLMSLRKKVTMIPFKKLTVWDLMKRLQAIADAEGVSVNRDHLRSIAKKSEGDLRSAINDLDTISRGKEVLSDVAVMQTGLREREVTIFDAMKDLFKTQSARMAKDSIGSVNKNPDEIFWWIENNVINEYEDPEEIAKAFDALSRADIFKRRIMSRQNWKLLAYMISLMTGGVAVAKKAPYKKFTRYQYPSNIMIMARTKFERASSKAAIDNMKKELHCSSRKIKWEFLPFLKIMARDDKLRENMIESFELDSKAKILD